MPNDLTSHTLSLPYIAPSQAQKHVTHNEALQRLDALVQLVLEETAAETPPSNPVNGEAYGIGPAPAGAWAGQAGMLALYQNDTWIFVAPRDGWQGWDRAQGTLKVFAGGVWLSSFGLGGLTELGVNATADSTNRLTVGAAATLLNHDGDDHRLKINRAGSADTASLVFQSGFSGRAEMGLAGDDVFRVKVSPDGSNFVTALEARPQSGTLVAPCLLSGGIEVDIDTIAQTATPGGSGMVAISLLHPSLASANYCGLFAYDTGTSLALRTLVAGSSDIVNQGATVLTGTTGAPGEIGISVGPGVLTFENRVSSMSTVAFTFFNSL